MPHYVKIRALLGLLLIPLVSGLAPAQNGTTNQAVQAAPVSLGTSGGNAGDIDSLYCCSGTLGALVTKNSTLYVLSANHIFARNDQALAGEAIIQPGLIDSGCSLTNTTTIAGFSEAPALGTRNVDAGLAAVVPGMVDSQGTILAVGVPASTAATASVHEAVAKSGRTTGLTCDAIASTNANVSVQYTTQCGTGATYAVTYTNQVLVNSPKFSAAGDSGSLIVDANTAQPVALLFAGSNSITVGNPIQDVMAALGVQFVGGAAHPVSCPVNGKRTRPNAGSFSSARDAKQKYAQQLMLDPAVMAVGVGADEENPSDAVVAIYVEQGRAHSFIPAELDGVRTKIYVSDRIRGYGWNEPQRQACHRTN